MAPRKRKLITTKDVSKLLKVSPEVITYLRQHESLPFVKRSKYILFSEPEVVRWRNRKLTENAENVLNLKDYFNKTHLFKFTTYEEFYRRADEIVFLDGDNVIQYLKRQNPAKDVQDLLGDIVSEYWNERKPRCSVCGEIIVSNLDTKLCPLCKKKRKDANNG